MTPVQELLAKLAITLDKHQAHIKLTFSKLGLYKAHPGMLENICVDYHGVATPLQQVANISTPDARTLEITPWDKELLPRIEKAIVQHKGNDFNPQNAGQLIRINLPALTEELRKKIVRNLASAAEAAKVSIRTERQQGMKQLQQLQLSEDELAKGKEALQKLIDKYTAQVEQLRQHKEKEVMTL